MDDDNDRDDDEVEKEDNNCINDYDDGGGGGGGGGDDDDNEVQVKQDKEGKQDDEEDEADEYALFMQHSSSDSAGFQHSHGNVLYIMLESTIDLDVCISKSGPLNPICDAKVVLSQTTWSSHSARS